MKTTNKNKASNAFTESLLSDVLASLEAFTNTERKEFAHVSYPTRMEVLGLSNPDLKKVLKELIQVSKHLLPEQKMVLSKELIQTKIIECEHLAFLYLESDKKALALFGEKDLKIFNSNLDNWASVDTFACCVLGIAWRNGQISDMAIHALAKDPNFWLRRLALAATVPLNLRSRGGKGDTEKTMAVCRLLVNDHEDMVVKALSWALRLLIFFDRKAVEEFLSTYEKSLHGRVKREVQNKLRTGLKNPL